MVCAEYQHNRSKSARLQRWFAAGGTVAIAGWILTQVSPGEILRAAGQIPWVVIVGLTVLLALVLLYLDSLSLLWLFRTNASSSSQLTLARTMQIRAASYLGTLLHFGIGQGVLAWLMARASGKSLTVAIGRCMVLATVDLLVLVSLAGLASLLTDHSTVLALGKLCRVFMLIGFGTALMGVIVCRVFGKHSLHVCNAISVPAQHLAVIVPLRSAFFMMGIVHAAFVLSACRLELDFQTAATVIPITAVLDALPISISGIGTREGFLLLVLKPEDPGPMVAGSLLWWATMTVSRLLIGLAAVGYAVLACNDSIRDLRKPDKSE